ncbi:NAD(P)/FAD-dependent oxidoreductase [Paenibacillus gansuensis]|uniref:Ferredoxin--NADP reductase n=1 Tax=Paenibacillus gansuensis TaxID=306542 RepID=A0ABW5PIN6_9BACL
MNTDTVIKFDPEEVYDVTIIGGGPAGLYSAFYSGLREMKTKLIEFQPVLGGKVHVYPEKMIWDVGGQPPIPGARLIEQIVQQGLTFQPTVVLQEKIVSLSRNTEGLFVLHAESGRLHYSKTVIVAVGSGILNPQKLTIEGAERFEVTNLHYTVKSLKQFKDKTVLLSGGGNSCVDWANELLPFAKQVIVTYRKDAFTGHEAQVKQLMESSAKCLFHTSITRLIAGEGDTSNVIRKVECTRHDNREVFELDVDEVIINHGYERDASLLEQSELNIEMAEASYIAGTSQSESSVEGLYAAGDILHHEGKLHLISGAFQDAANAVNRAKRFIQPDAQQHAMVSSHNEVFKERNKEAVKQWVR